MDPDIQALLACLGSPPNNTKPNNTIPTEPTPTRSGRIPQRPDPNHSNLLDFLIFPEDSESDDPDFDPFNTPLNADTLLHVPSQLSKKPDSASSLDIPFHFNPPQPLASTSSQTDNIGFDFSTFSENYEPVPPSIQPTTQPAYYQSDHSNFNNPTFPPPPPQPNKSTIQEPTTSSKLSPLTEGALAGVPFININFPESDDSPEFIPPPFQSTSSSAKKKARKDLNPRSSDHYLDGPHASTSTSVHKRTCSATSNIDPSLQPCSSVGVPKKTRQEPKQTQEVKLPPSISSRYVAIAPNPNYPDPAQSNTYREQPKRHQTMDYSDDNEDIDDDRESEASHQIPVHPSGQYSKNQINHSGVLTKLKPGPKPKSLIRSSSDLQPPLLLNRDDAMKRKREGMRQSRERKKLYIVSLEDRCLELAEENARLKEENQVLLRESRENWKSKAKSLEIMKTLTTEIERLKQGREAAEAVEEEDEGEGEGERLVRRRNQEEKNKRLNKVSVIRQVPSSSLSCLNDQDENENNNKLHGNKRRRLHDSTITLNLSTNHHSSSSSSFVPTRPCGRTLLDVVAVKPR